MANGQREQRRYLTTRATVDPRVSFDVTTPALDVFAKTTDPMVFDGNAGGRAKRLAEALGIIQGTMPLVGQALEAGANRAHKEGALDALSGKEKPTTGMMRIHGWESLKGEMTARREYREELNSFFNENHLEMTPEEFETGVQEISQKYLQGASNSFLEGFLKYAVDIEQSIFDKYNNTQREIVRQESMDMLSSKAHNTAVDSLTNYLTSRFEGIEELDDILTRPDVLWQIDIEGTLGQELSPILRADLTEAQIKGKQLGFQRHEVNALYLEQVGELAVRYGMPELLDFLRLPDSDGIAPIKQALTGKPAFQYLARAEGERKASINEHLKALAQADAETKKKAEEELKERIEGIKKDFDGYLISLEKTAEINPQLASEQALELLAVMFDPASEFFRVDATFHSKILRGVMDIAAMDTTFRNTSDGEVLEQLIEFTRENKLTYEILLEARPYLSLSDWEKYNTLLTKQEEIEWNNKVKEFRGTVANHILDIKYEQDPQQRQFLALHYLRKLNEDPMFWELGYEATVGFRNDLYAMATQDVVFAQKDDGEVFKNLNEARYNKELTQQDIMEASPFLTQSTWESFLDALIKQDEELAKAEQDRINEELRLTAEEEKEAKEARVSYYNDELGNVKLMNTLEARKRYSELLEEFDTDSLVQGVDETTRNKIRNQIIEGILENRTYASVGQADDLLFAQLLQEIPEGTVTYALIDGYVEQGLFTKDMHLTLLREVRAKIEADAQELARIEEEKRKEAEKTREENLKKAEKAEEERRERAKNQFIKDMSSAISDISTLQTPHERRTEAERLKQVLREGDKKHNIPHGTYTSLYNSLNKIIGEYDSFASESDRETVMLLDYQVLYGILDYDDVVRYAQEGLLSQSDFFRYSNAYADQVEQLDKTIAEENKINAQYVNDAIKEIVALAVGGDPFGINLGAVEQAQASSLRLGFLDANYDFLEQHGRPPTRDEFLGKIVPAVLSSKGYDVSEVLAGFARFDNPFIEPEEIPVTDRVKLEDLRFPKREVSTWFGLGPTKTVTEEDPEYSMSKQEAFNLFGNYFDQGMSINEVLTAVNAHLMETGRAPLVSEEAKKYWVQNYADMTVAYIYLENYNLETKRPDVLGTHDLIVRRLGRLGYTKEEILGALHMGRLYFDMAMDQARMKGE